MGKTKRGLKPSLSSKAISRSGRGGQNYQRKELRNYRGTTVTACIVSVKTKILATLRKAGEYIYSSEILLRIAKFRDCLSKVLVKIRSGMNVPKRLLMLQIGNKYPFDA